MIDLTLSRVGLVAIGRNEGERLRACLTSVVGLLSHIVYVDSGSTDGSVSLAEAMGVHVVNLDMAVPFTAARARNEGWRALLEMTPELDFIQFVDGDCVVAKGWLQQAQDFLLQNRGHAVVCGRRREKCPEQSIYNLMCDLEWDTPLGDVKACGGDALMRASALQQVGGYRDDLIAGEEPEMCVRLRQAGWRVHRLDAEMSLHDANMHYFGQWWKRSVRSGHAYAEGAWLHGGSRERHRVKDILRILFWGLVYPSAVVLLTALYQPMCGLLLLAYPVQVLRMSRGRGGWRQALFVVIGKFPETWGALKFYRRLIFGGSRKLIEYK